MTPLRVNPWVEPLTPYVPGEQPRGVKFVKLNTNENPYPPAVGVTDAVRQFFSEKARRYPDPVSVKLREAIGARLGFPASRVIAGNGSDELLRMVCHAFAAAGDEVGMFDPTYSLYPVLTAMFGLRTRMFPVDFAGRPAAAPDLSGLAIFFVGNPNPPYGTWCEPEWIGGLARAHESCLVVVDEAYVDFANGDCLTLARELDNVLVVRTFSKSYSLAGLRVGFAVGSETAIEVLNRIRDSYNLNALSQAAALAAWEDRAYFEESVRRIRETRERLQPALEALGFLVEPSAGNFLFARRDDAAQVYERLREKGVLVRYFSQPPLEKGLRITIGTDAEADTLLEKLQEIDREN